jgi:hypothetical protein
VLSFLGRGFVKFREGTIMSLVCIGLSIFFVSTWAQDTTVDDIRSLSSSGSRRSSTSTASEAEVQSFFKGFRDVPGYSSLVQKVTHSIDRKQNVEDEKEKASSVFQVVQQILPRGISLTPELLEQMGTSTAQRWVRNQECNYTSRDVKRALVESPTGNPLIRATTHHQ